jgi:arylsulfatase A-like enzyme
VGHATIFSGTSPNHHGIVGNAWYDRKLKKKIYSVEDTTEQTVGGESKKKSVSARDLLCTNLLDELKISTTMKSHVVSVSLKDRAAVLMAGHMADGAYWLDLNTGNFVTSTYYKKQLPDWVKRFNNERNAFKYLENTWNPLLSYNQYPFSLEDDNNYEVILKGKERPVFPYDLKKLAPLNKPYFEVLYTSPFGNSILTDFAINAIQNEKLGQNTCTDFLAISYSSTDAVGHEYGPLSKEVNDTYLRLDKEIARLLNQLDSAVGKGNYTLFLTADHGMAEVPEYLNDHKVPVKYIKFDDIFKQSEAFLDEKLGKEEWIVFARNQQLYFDRDLIRNKGLDLATVQNLLAGFLKEKEGIARVYTANQLDNQEFTLDISAMVQKGFCYKRSGDIKIVYDPGCLDDDYENTSASSHGIGYTYDTHIPLIWFGAGIRKGESFTHYNMTDIAPTASMMLHIKLPGACTGNPISEILSK